MTEQKRFQKVILNSDDYKWIERAAKATKGVGAGLAVTAGVFAIGTFLKEQLSDSDEKSEDENEQEVE